VSATRTKNTCSSSLVLATVAAVRDNIDDDEIIVETAYRSDPALWEPDLKTRRTSR